MIKKFVVILLVIIGIFIGYMNSGLGIKYAELYGSPESRAIKFRFADKIAVMPAIIDYQIENGYAFGFRLPSYQATCEQGRFSSQMVTFEKVYFVFHLDSERLSEFQNQRAFTEYLVVLALDEQLTLDFKLLDKAIAGFKTNYKAFAYFATCKPL